MKLMNEAIDKVRGKSNRIMFCLKSQDTSGSKIQKTLRSSKMRRSEL